MKSETAGLLFLQWQLPEKVFLRSGTTGGPSSNVSTVSFLLSRLPIQPQINCGLKLVLKLAVDFIIRMCYVY